jgi:hypothetical protein
MTLDQRLTHAVHRVADGVTVPEVDVDAVRSRARRNRRRTISVAVIAAVVAVIVAGTTVVGGRDTSAPEPVHPVRPPQIVGSGPVWYDAAGLHHGAVVEQTAVELFSTATDVEHAGGVLALVRGGALYRDPATDDVWFHPWGGEPRVVGHDSAAGPGGDLEGDVAAWFEGPELVVYDTARDREISRTTETPALDYATWEQSGGNGFRHVSAEEIVWGSAGAVHRLDLATGKSSILWDGPGYGSGAEDVHNGTRVRHDLEASDLILDVDGRQQRRLPALGPEVELSSDGSFLLAPNDSDTNTPHPAAIVDVRSGERWNLPGGDHGYPAIAWSYGDVALVLVDRGRGEAPPLACYALSRECEELPFQGPVLLPTS